MMKRFAMAVGLAVIGPGMLAACGEASRGDGSAVSKSGAYGDAEELRAAAVELGFKCRGWEVTKGGLAPARGLAESSGECNVGADGDGGDQFFVYGPGRAAYGGDPYTVKDQLDYWTSEFDGFPGAQLITGKNWIISLESGDDYEKLARRLDGTIRR